MINVRLISRNLILSGAAALGMAVASLFGSAEPVLAQAEGMFSRDTPAQRGRDRGQYIPTISVTPDGCEVWVMDDGAEGYAVAVQERSHEDSGDLIAAKIRRDWDESADEPDDEGTSTDSATSSAESA